MAEKQHHSVPQAEAPWASFVVDLERPCRPDQIMQALIDAGLLDPEAEVASVRALTDTHMVLTGMRMTWNPNTNAAAANYPICTCGFVGNAGLQPSSIRCPFHG